MSDLKVYTLIAIGLDYDEDWVMGVYSTPAKAREALVRFFQQTNEINAGDPNWEPQDPEAIPDLLPGAEFAWADMDFCLTEFILDGEIQIG